MTKRFESENLPAAIQEKADRMNLDERLVNKYVLPPVLNADSTDSDSFQNCRRRELLSLFEKHLYGKIPQRCESLSFEISGEGEAFNGLAVRREIIIHCIHCGIQRDLRMLLYIPVHRKSPVPVFFGLNFKGNIACTTDTDAKFDEFLRYPSLGSIRYEDLRCDASQRGKAATRWEFERVLKRGFAVATICYFDIFPDRPDGFENSVMRMFYTPEFWYSPERDTGAISAWAWGISRAVDCLEAQSELDASRIFIHGLSRLGKAALWAGANDVRIALTSSHCSGCCGAKLSHRNFGENFEWILQWNPQWMRADFAAWNGRDSEFPIDQHMLMALIAPRLLFIASADHDDYADPRGEFAAAKAASDVYLLFGAKGLVNSEFFTPDTPSANGTIGYYLRAGEHNCTPENWSRLLDFAVRHTSS